VPMTFLKFSREFEAQADYLGVQYMYRAGYDPQAFISFFEKVQALEKRKPGLVAKAFATIRRLPTASCTRRRRLRAFCRRGTSTR
jgi:beta-barrel assembly-enhancing protease